jgi:hypothetical protein
MATSEVIDDWICFRIMRSLMAKFWAVEKMTRINGEEVASLISFRDFESFEE